MDGDWEIFHRRYTPPSKTNPGANGRRLPGSPTPPARISTSWPPPTPAASSGWPGRAGARTTSRSCWRPWPKAIPGATPRVISTSKANDWSPAIAADSKGNVYVAYDTYDKGNYDVMLVVVGKESKTIPIATSARFEARPHIVCDAKDRVWIAYEEGDEQWGKDYANAHSEKDPGEKPRLAALSAPHGQGQMPGGRQAATARRRPGKGSARPAGSLRNKSCPRLTVDEAGGVWLLSAPSPLARRRRRGVEQFRLPLRRQAVVARRAA